MRSNLLTLAILSAMIFCSSPDAAWAQRGRGGGGIRGGGGGGFSGSGARMSAPMNSGISRPATTANHLPTMSRAAPSISQTGRSPNLPNRNLNAGQGVSNQFGGARTGVAANRTGAPSLQSTRSFQKPSNQQLDNFLNIPTHGNPSAASTSGYNASRSGRTTDNSGTGNTKSFTTDSGTTITVGGKAGSGTTQGGANVGGAVGGIKVETAGGDTFVRGSGVAGASKGDSAAIAAGSRTGVKTNEGGAAVAGRGVRAGTDGENSAVRGGGFAAGRDSQGNVAGAARGGYADSSGYRQGGAIAGSLDTNGYTRIDAAFGSSNNGIGQVNTGTAIMGPNGNVISAGRGGTFVNGQFVGGNSWTAVNGNYTHWNYFGPGYPGNYPNCWWPGKWAVTATAWSVVAYSLVGPYCGCSSAATYYDYGANVNYQDGMVYYGDEAVATDEQYYAEASEIAANGETADNDEWLPLGVFAIIAEADQDQTDKVVQLAINKDGIIRGNYHDVLADQVTPVYGSVDKESQRVALKLEGNDQLVVDTGLYNLTNDECPVLIHFDESHQEDRVFIRLQPPEQE